jgi:uncharacterized protein
MLSQEQIETVTRKIVDGYKPKKIIIFGSYANGDPTEDSDLDLLIIKQTSTPFHQRAREVRKLLSDSLFSLDLLVYTPLEYDTYKDQRYSFLNKILREGRICYESNTE